MLGAAFVGARTCRAYVQFCTEPWSEPIAPCLSVLFGCLVGASISRAKLCMSMLIEPDVANPVHCACPL